METIGKEKQKLIFLGTHNMPVKRDNTNRVDFMDYITHEFAFMLGELTRELPEFGNLIDGCKKEGIIEVSPVMSTADKGYGYVLNIEVYHPGFSFSLRRAINGWVSKDLGHRSHRPILEVDTERIVYLLKSKWFKQDD